MRYVRYGYFLVLVFVAIATMTSAAPIEIPKVYEVPGGTHGYNAVTANGTNISFGTMNGVPGRVVNGTFFPYQVPPGYTNLVAGHPSQSGQIAVFNGICGGQACSVVYGAGEPQLFPGLQLWQVGNNGDLAGATEGGQPVRLSLADRNPIELSAGTDVGATILGLAANGTATGATFKADGSSSMATVWTSDGTRLLLQQSTTQAGAIAISENGLWATGSDGGFAVLWDIVNNIEKFLQYADGSYIPGSGVTVLNDGTTSGGGFGIAGWLFQAGKK